MHFLIKQIVILEAISLKYASIRFQNEIVGDPVDQIVDQKIILKIYLEESTALYGSFMKPTRALPKILLKFFSEPTFWSFSSRGDSKIFKISLFSITKIVKIGIFK